MWLKVIRRGPLLLALFVIGFAAAMESDGDSCVVHIHRAYCECPNKQKFCQRSKHPFEDKSLPALWQQVAAHYQNSPLHRMPQAKATAMAECVSVKTERWERTAIVETDMNDMNCATDDRKEGMEKAEGASVPKGVENSTPRSSNYSDHSEDGGFVVVRTKDMCRRFQVLSFNGTKFVVGPMLKNRGVSKKRACDTLYCFHPEEEMKGRGSGQGLWWTCEACGARWDRIPLSEFEAKHAFQNWDAERSESD